MVPRSIVVLAALALSLSPAAADTFNINVDNGESTMLLLTVTDMNYPDPKEVYNGSINSGQMLSVHINGDSGRNGHIQWKTRTPDRQKCGSGDVKDLSSGSNLTVKTPSSC